MYIISGTPLLGIMPAKNHAWRKKEESPLFRFVLFVILFYRFTQITIHLFCYYITNKQ